MKAESPILKIEKLTKTFSNGDYQKKVLEGIGLEIDEKEFLCILGTSGCGKTTLLRCIAGFEAYDGSIFVKGVKRQEPDIDRMMVFQDFNQLFPWKTVEGNIQYPLKVQGIKDKKVLKDMSDSALEKNCTFIFLTHNIQEAIILGKRILVLAKNGKVVLDHRNIIERPVTPASEGYGELWQKLRDALYS